MTQKGVPGARFRLLSTSSHDLFPHVCFFSSLISYLYQPEKNKTHRDFSGFMGIIRNRRHLQGSGGQEEMENQTHTHS